MLNRKRCSTITLGAAFLLGALPGVVVGDDSQQLAQRSTIHRDEYGLAHIVGEDDESVMFALGYVQAEDFFWQVEDSYILALGRYSEVHGPQGLNSDLLNRAFEIVPRSRRDFAALDAVSQRLYAAFVAGINRYLTTHREVRPRLIQKFEPWHVLALHRQIALELCFRYTGLGDEFLPRRNPTIDAATGSNGWAINGARTKDGRAMLLAAPHMPWFGFSQLAEAHLVCRGSDKEPGWNFTGAGFYGSPALALGHNAHLGWTLVTNQPDIADLWRERFDKPDEPLAYAYGDGWRTAEQWSEEILVRKSHEVERRRFTFCKTHHGPIVAHDEQGKPLAAQISGLFESVPLRQWLRMAKSNNLDEFRTALASMQILYSNILYADDRRNIWFLYNGRIPRRDARFDWTKPVDGADPRTEWLGVYELDELPQVLNPSAGFLENCNSSPLNVTEPVATNEAKTPAVDFPRVLIGEGDELNRRAKRSTEILRGLQGVDFERWRQLAFDDVAWWPRERLPQYAATLKSLEKTAPATANKVRPYLEHLLAWDGRVTADSTAATLCQHWYELLYGSQYPGEKLRASFRGDEQKQLAALATAAEKLVEMHGDWRIPYGELFRIQRQPQVADLADLRFDDRRASLPCLGAHGPMGATFSVYYSPSVAIPLVYSQRRRYGVAGASYVGAWEFSPQGVRGASLVPFGAAGDAASPHDFDQAALLSQRRLKDEHFTEEEVVAAAKRSYHPGSEEGK